MYQIGAPIPDLQRESFVDGVLIGRTDFCWEVADCIGEMDGDVKYLGGGVSGGKSAEQVVLAEKHREDALRRLVTAFIRFIWDDALAIAPLEPETRPGEPETCPGEPETCPGEPETRPTSPRDPWQPNHSLVAIGRWCAS
ncbi:MAG: hypothetical protein LPK92_04795 [Actinomycetes bacterium]|nr:hypothetical protein [Actinomycetes bacterium]MDX5399025.1 hypothetical protein [Actinomycetes bacterium]